MKTYGRNAAGFSIREIVFTGLMTALVFVATYVPHIPIPLGYANLGDAVIFLLAVLAPRRSVLFAACLGSAMADIFGGFALWAGPTILIKLIMAEIVCRLGQNNAAPAGRARCAAAFLLASLWMAAGYTLAGAVLYDGMAAALASTPGLIAEGIANSILALLLVPALREHIPQW